MTLDIIWNFICYNEEHPERGGFKIKFVRIPFIGVAIVFYDPNSKAVKVSL